MRPEETPDDRFELLERIGEGGAGRVFRAVDREGGGVVALKILHDRSPRAPERFAAEARVLAALAHPHVVRYVAHGVTGAGDPYLAMEWLEGESLLARLGRGPLGVEESLELGRGVADALAAAHARGIVHRDVKPSNLFLAGGAVASVRVLDFGLASDFEENVGLSGSGAGTPGYMAPEQVRGERSRIDARADVFSLGAVLYQCLTGQRAFPGVHTMAVLAQILLADAPRVRELAPGVPAALDALVARLLAREPGQRPADGAAVLAALEALGPGGRGVLHSVPPPPPAEAITGEEQRLLAVIAVKGAGALEQVRSLMIFEGARVDELGVIEGERALLVTLAAAPSATDQAARAARAALHLRAALPGAALALAMGQGEAGGGFPAGAVVGRVAELHAVAGPGAPVRIDDVTHALLDDRFEVRADGGAHVLLRERDAHLGARSLLGKPTPYVGRERELRMLTELIGEAFAGDRGAQVAVVTAPPGMGKTRLRHELARSLRATHPGLAGGTGRGDVMRAGSAFAMAASALRSALALGADDPPNAVRACLDERCARILPQDRRARVAAFLAEMMGAPDPAGELPELRAARHSAARMAAEIARAFVEFVGGVCARSPVLVVLEDLHWGDAASVQLFDQALRDLEAQPFVVLGLARPEVYDIFPDLWSRRDVHHVRLGPLPRRAAEELCTRTLGSVSGSDVAALVGRAAGNAFYLEELIRAYASKGSVELPETVIGMVAERLAALPSAPRVLLRAASVFGESFPMRGALALLSEGEREEARLRWLPWLVQQEIVLRRPAAGDDLHAFRHALLRDGSYAGLTQRDRTLGHRLAGAWLAEESSGGGGAQIGDAVIGEHFFRGEAWDEAAVHLTRAGDAAKGLHANVEARRHYARALQALDHLPDGDALRRRRLDTVIEKVSVSYGDDPGPNLELLALAEGAAASLPGASSPPDADFRRLARVRYWMGRCHWYRSAYPEAVGYYRKVLDAARRLDDEELAALPSGTLGRVLLAQGHFGRTIPLLEASLGPLERGEVWDEWVVNAGFVGVSLALRGRAGEAVAQGERVLAQARESQSPTSESIALTMLGGIHLFSGDPARGRALFGLAAEAADRAGDRVYAYLAHGFGAAADSRLGLPEAAASGMARSRSIMRELGRRLVFADWFDAFAVESAAIAGRDEEALAAAESAVLAFRPAGSTFAEAVAHRAWALALARRAESLDEALTHLAESLRLLDAGEAHVEAARTRLLLARVLRERGDAEGAAAALAAASLVPETTFPATLDR
jgi:tetratricopeptide (TPR) repeat protein